jgi:hypothetical protein
MEEIRAKRTGMTVQKWQENPQPWFSVRRQDLEWVDEATHVVALVNAPSLGVGMEIQRAIDKPRLGMNSTPILCLISKDRSPGLSFMIRGVSEEESPLFQLREYENLNQAQKHIHNFLTSTRTNLE